VYSDSDTSCIRPLALWPGLYPVSVCVCVLFCVWRRRVWRSRGEWRDRWFRVVEWRGRAGG
jgi:hypothetical protein